MEGRFKAILYTIKYTSQISLSLYLLCKVVKCTCAVHVRLSVATSIQIGENYTHIRESNSCKIECTVCKIGRVEEGMNFLRCDPNVKNSQGSFHYKRPH